MTARISKAALAAVLGFSLACGMLGTDPPPPPPPAPQSFEAKVGTIARAIDQDPSKRAAVLAENAMTPEEYETALFEIAMDPGRTKAYLEARESSD